MPIKRAIPARRFRESRWLVGRDGVGAARLCAGPSDQGGSNRMRRTSAAMVDPSAVEQRGRDVSRQLRPSDSQFEWARRGDQSGECTRHGGTLDPAVASRGGKIVQIAPFQRSRTPRAGGGLARRHVVHHDKLHFVNRHLFDPFIFLRGLMADLDTLLPERALVAKRQSL